MADFTKYAYEEIYRFFEFKRTDGKDGLATGETVDSAVVTCADSAGVDCTAAMISNTSTVNSTQVTYKLKAGSVGKAYTVTIKAVTSLGQKLEGIATIAVI